METFIFIIQALLLLFSFLVTVFVFCVAVGAMLTLIYEIATVWSEIIEEFKSKS